MICRRLVSQNNRVKLQPVSGLFPWKSLGKHPAQPICRRTLHCLTARTATPHFQAIRAKYLIYMASAVTDSGGLRQRGERLANQWKREREAPLCHDLPPAGIAEQPREATTSFRIISMEKPRQTPRSAYLSKNFTLPHRPDSDPAFSSYSR